MEKMGELYHRGETPSSSVLRGNLLTRESCATAPKVGRTSLGRLRPGRKREQVPRRLSRVTVLAVHAREYQNPPFHYRQGVPVQESPDGPDPRIGANTLPYPKVMVEGPGCVG